MTQAYSLRPEVLIADFSDYQLPSYSYPLPHFPAEQLTTICNSAERAQTPKQLLEQVSRLLCYLESFTQNALALCHPFADVLSITLQNLYHARPGSTPPTQAGVYLNPSVQLDLGHDVVVSPLAVPAIWADQTEESFGNWIAQPTTPLTPIYPTQPNPNLGVNQETFLGFRFQIDPLFTFHEGKSTLHSETLGLYASQIAKRPDQPIAVLRSIRRSADGENRPAAFAALATLATASICIAAHST